MLWIHASLLIYYQRRSLLPLFWMWCCIVIIFVVVANIAALSPRSAHVDGTIPVPAGTRPQPLA